MQLIVKDLSNFIDVLTSQKLNIIIVNNVIKTRKALKLSQKELAKRSGVSYGSIKRFEQHGEISLRSLLKIADALNALQDFVNLFSTQQVKDLKDEWKTNY